MHIGISLPIRSTAIAISPGSPIGFGNEDSPVLRRVALNRPKCRMFPSKICRIMNFVVSVTPTKVAWAKDIVRHRAPALAQ